METRLIYSKFNSFATVLLCMLSIALMPFVHAEAPTHEDEPALALNEDEGNAQNRLKGESSPYLQQHANNPVHWFPWCDEAFELANKENKPIFLSVGYSTCYWCKVMEKESFEDSEVAKVLNDHFIAIKVDREERPEIDRRFLHASRLITGKSGWPNSVWLTPEGKPWMAGSYFPKEKFIGLLSKLSDTWSQKRNLVDKIAEQVSNEIDNSSILMNQQVHKLEESLLSTATQTLLDTYDSEHGGFGESQKFPPCNSLEFLIHRFHQTESIKLRKVILDTLDAMYLGGIHDHLGGGFHRYTTDRRWRVPHFEKMLCDNAQLIKVYTEGYLISGNEHYLAAIDSTYKWLERQMLSPDGVFYSAIDAGEIGKEGDYYLWNLDQINKVLGLDGGKVFSSTYNLQMNGNFLDNSSTSRPGKNILYLTQPLTKTTEQLDLPANQSNFIKECKTKLLKSRLSRVRPHRDEKVLTSWNGLAISSLTHAGDKLDKPEYIASASRAANFLLEHMLQNEILLRSHSNGKAKLPGYLDDYGYFLEGLLRLHEATGDSRWLEKAQLLAEIVYKNFYDQKHGGFYYSTAQHEALFNQAKLLNTGGNLPDANGIATRAFLQISRLTGEKRYKDAAVKSLQAMSGMMAKHPHGNLQLLIALSEHLATDDTDTTN